MGYIFLILTILVESAAILLMKLSHGFQHKSFGILAIVFYAAGFFLLTWSLKYLPVGLANAIWAGASTLIVALMGFLFFKETFTWQQLIFLVFIVIGLVGLNYFQNSSGQIG